MPSVAGSQIAASAARKTRASSDRVGREYVQGLQRGFAVIKAFGADAQALTIADVAARTGLTRAVARRYLLTLGELGCAVHNGSQFRLTPRVLDLGFTYLSTIDVADVATLRFNRNSLNTPVYLLATGDITIAGKVDVSGSDGQLGVVGIVTNGAS